jgi:hypothetical protein
VVIAEVAVDIVGDTAEAVVIIAGPIADDDTDIVAGVIGTIMVAFGMLIRGGLALPVIPTMATTTMHL